MTVQEAVELLRASFEQWAMPNPNYEQICEEALQFLERRANDADSTSTRTTAL